MPRKHSALPRLYVAADLPRPGALVSLDPGQSIYLASVLRRRIGDRVVLFNGRDGAWLAALVADGKRAVSLSLAEQIAAQPAPHDLWYGFAPLKSERLDYLVQKATEMGAGAIQPVRTKFTQASRIKADRLLANIVEAAEQCEVLNVPSLLPEVPLDRLLKGWDRDRHLIFADEAAAGRSPLAALQKLRNSPVGLLVGPEGGFSDEERSMLRSMPFVVPISLGPRILRADTAGVAALAVIQASIGDWGQEG